MQSAKPTAGSSSRMKTYLKLIGTREEKWRDAAVITAITIH
jgi:hypothetical protein